MRTRVVHCNAYPIYDVYIGRPSDWGNPYSHLEKSAAQFKVETREEAIEKYREWIKTQPELLARLPELKGKSLGCWCKPFACHGDVLASMADALP
jgi:Domain of unknown function (DUF4326)